ncbi:MAG TPA: SDR family NAD(P)-dependent oxidoreductase, partial [Sporolactobacillaceae bacterium]|nr:SDR family NAD(P)-dependent oxidoreductase [Sporolactobacillaceae bacterium]
MASKNEKGVAAVVGVGAGLGAALATRFASGYKVALIARSAELIGKVAGEIKSAGGVALPVQSDATIEAEIADAHKR